MLTCYHARCIDKELPHVLICLGQLSLKHVLTNRFVSVVGYISHINDCINTFNACTFENIYKIDDLYNISGNNMKLIFDIIE